MSGVNHTSTSRRVQAAQLGERLLFKAVTHSGDETRMCDALEQAIRRVDSEAGRTLVAEAVEAAIVQANRGSRRTKVKSTS